MKIKVKNRRRFRDVNGKLGGYLHPNFQYKNTWRGGAYTAKKYQMPKLPEANPEGTTLYQREPLAAYNQAKEMWFKGIGVDDIRVATGVPLYKIKSWIHGHYYDPNSTEEQKSAIFPNPWIKERAEKEEKLVKEVYQDIKAQLEETIQTTLIVIQKGIQRLDAVNHELSATEISALSRTLESLHAIEELEASKIPTADSAKKGTKMTVKDILEMLKKADPMINYSEEKTLDTDTSLN